MDTKFHGLKKTSIIEETSFRGSKLFGLSRLRIEATVYRSCDQQVNHYTTELITIESDKFV
jgi:hypothetical protein